MLEWLVENEFMFSIVFITVTVITCAIIGAIWTVKKDSGLPLFFMIVMSVIIVLSVIVPLDIYCEKQTIKKTGYTTMDNINISRVKNAIENGDECYISVKEQDLVFDAATGTLYRVQHFGGRTPHNAFIPVFDENEKLRNIYREQNIAEDERLEFCLEQEDIIKRS